MNQYIKDIIFTLLILVAFGLVFMQVSGMVELSKIHIFLVLLAWAAIYHFSNKDNDKDNATSEYREPDTIDDRFRMIDFTYGEPRVEINGYILHLITYYLDYENKTYSIADTLLGQHPDWSHQQIKDYFKQHVDEIYSDYLLKIDNRYYLCIIPNRFYPAYLGWDDLYDFWLEAYLPIIEKWYDEHLKLPYYTPKEQEGQIKQLSWHRRRPNQKEFETIYIADYCFSKTGSILQQQALGRPHGGTIMSCLTRISLPEKESLIVEEYKTEKEEEISIPTRDSSDIKVPIMRRVLGDTCKLLVKTSDGDLDKDIWRHLKIEDSREGAWEAYLLYEFWHVLPLFWHANYSKRLYVFSMEDFDRIGHCPFAEDDELRPKCLANAKSLFIEPQVKKEDGNYKVMCCYWSEFGGFIQETVEVSISEGRASFKEIEEKRLIGYHCNVTF